MQQTDKNIFIFTILAIIFLIAWTLFRYNTTQTKYAEHEENTKEEVIESLDNKQNHQIQKDTQKTTIPTISASEIHNKLFTKKNVIIVDARTPKNFAKAHIRDSIHINDFDETISDSTIIFVTSNGSEDGLLDYYRDLSNTNEIYNLSNGFTGWLTEGFNTISLDIQNSFENNSKVTFIEPRELDSILSNDSSLDKIIILDTRRQGNYSKEHLQNAINMPFDNLEYEYKKIPQGKELYVYGQDEVMSFKSGVLLYDLGFFRVKTIKGGLNAWKEYGYPTSTKSTTDKTSSENKKQ